MILAGQMISRPESSYKSSVCRAFTLVEVLVVIGIISMLMSILLPVLGRVREQAMVTVANAELYGIGLALEAYSLDNRDKFPPTRFDCNPCARAHAYALPQELVDDGYLPKGGETGRVHWAKIEDQFNKGRTYKYIAVGPKYDFFGTPFSNQALYMPSDYPHGVQTGRQLTRFDRRSNSPVTWVVFSVGPRHDIRRVEEGNFPIKEGYPVLEEFWYSPISRKGILTRVRLKKGRHLGTFE